MPHVMISRKKCTGCHMCELACSAYHEGAYRPSVARLFVRVQPHHRRDQGPHLPADRLRQVPGGLSQRRHRDQADHGDAQGLLREQGEGRRLGRGLRAHRRRGEVHQLRRVLRGVPARASSTSTPTARSPSSATSATASRSASPSARTRTCWPSTSRSTRRTRRSSPRPGLPALTMAKVSVKLPVGSVTGRRAQRGRVRGRHRAATRWTRPSTLEPQHRACGSSVRTGRMYAGVFVDGRNVKLVGGLEAAAQATATCLRIVPPISGG